MLYIGQYFFAKLLQFDLRLLISLQVELLSFYSATILTSSFLRIQQFDLSIFTATTTIYNLFRQITYQWIETTHEAANVI
jgi:hypothetical protein